MYSLTAESSARRVMPPTGTRSRHSPQTASASFSGTPLAASLSSRKLFLMTVTPNFSSIRWVHSSSHQ